MYVIAEIGINHNGDINLALDMMRYAKIVGANCVKFQKRNPDICVPEEQKNQPRFWKNKDMTYLEYKWDIEFGKEEYDLIAATAKEIGIDWTASVWDVDSLHFMEQYKNDIPFIKVPSACITDFELLEAVKASGMKVVMSGGMATAEMVLKAAVYLEPNIIGLLHCNSTYPSNENELDLNVIEAYHKKFPDLFIGYSSHDISNFPCLLAAAAGAQIIERHFTTDTNLPGTDQKSSVNPIQMSELITQLDRVDKIMGQSYPTFYKSEQIIAKKLRRV